MIETHTRNMIEALLGEYTIVVADLQCHVRDVTPAELVTAVDTTTSDPDCVSVQSILTHVVASGHRYVRMIDAHRRGSEAPMPQRKALASSAEYLDALDAMLRDTRAYFETLTDAEMVAHDPAAKLTASWGQLFDYEQLFEHAIVHVSRHRRQVVRFLGIIRSRSRGSA